MNFNKENKESSPTNFFNSIFSGSNFSPCTFLPTPKEILSGNVGNGNVGSYNDLFGKVMEKNKDYITEREKGEISVRDEDLKFSPILQFDTATPSDLLNNKYSPGMKKNEVQTKKTINNFYQGNFYQVQKGINSINSNNNVNPFQITKNNHHIIPTITTKQKHYYDPQIRIIQNQNQNQKRQYNVPTLSKPPSKKRKRNNQQNDERASKKQRVDTLPPKKSVHFTQMTNNTKFWKIKYVDQKFQNKIKIHVNTKTRCDNYEDKLPDTIYSSLKYILNQEVYLEINEKPNFILSTITAIDGIDFTEIRKNDKIILKGQTQCALNSSNKSSYDGFLKVQFTDVSYHHKKHNFCFRISYFLPNDLERPICVIVSNDFKVLARKPTQGKKRKSRNKKQKKGNDIESFQKKLDELIKTSRKLNGNEKNRAYSLVSDKLYELDPTYFSELRKK